MAQTLRQPLTPGVPPVVGPGWPAVLAVALVGLVVAPLLPGLWLTLAPAAHASVWAALWVDPQWPRALQATLTSALLGTALACALTAGAATHLYPSATWLRLQRRLPLLLAVPHAAFAVGLAFLLAPSGWLARLVAPVAGWAAPPAWVSVQDPHGLALALALALKESFFLLWVLMAVLAEQATARHLLLARSLGYSPAQVWRSVLWPQVLPRLAWSLAAVLAYSLSVVDMALVLGPGNPPTVAVLAWRWLGDPSPDTQAQGAAAALVLLCLWAALASAAWALWRGWRVWLRRATPSGIRADVVTWVPTAWRLGVVPWFGVGAALVALLVPWSVADGWFFPALWPQGLTLRHWQAADTVPLITTLWLAAAASAVCLPVALAWLEWGPQRANAVLYLPLVLPALPLAAGQYTTLLHTGLDGTATGLLWAHLLWVLPYTVLTLVGPYRALDPRLLTTARALGLTRWQACLRVKWPLLLRPLCAAAAVGFAVSVAQYLPTQFAGGGRFVTVTTEAVNLSAGGHRSVLAVQALLQVALPLAAFACASAWPRWATRHRLGVR